MIKIITHSFRFVYISVGVLLFSSITFGQTKTYVPISFSLKSNSSFFKPELRKSADSALIIAAAVLNSQEFRDSISKYFFPCKNYLSQCKTKCRNCSDTIPTRVILDSLYRLKRDSLQLILLNDGVCKGGGSFGYSSADVFIITSHFITIDCDDDVLSFAYKYAYHICHEYMHIVGFYHYLNPKRRIRDKDIAEKTGWIAYSILDRWHKMGKKIEGL